MKSNSDVMAKNFWGQHTAHKLVLRKIPFLKNQPAPYMRIGDSRADVHFISFLFAIGLLSGLKIIY